MPTAVLTPACEGREGETRRRSLGPDRRIRRAPDPHRSKTMSPVANGGIRASNLNSYGHALRLEWIVES